MGTNAGGGRLCRCLMCGGLSTALYCTFLQSISCACIIDCVRWQPRWCILRNRQHTRCLFVHKCVAALAPPPPHSACRHRFLLHGAASGAAEAQLWRPVRRRRVGKQPQTLNQAERVGSHGCRSPFYGKPRAATALCWIPRLVWTRQHTSC